MQKLGATWIGWSALLLTLGFAIGLALVHEGELLNIAFTPFVVAIAAVLFRSYPRQYVFYAFSLWMFTPLVRRLADWQSTYHIVSPVMLAPLMVTGLCAITVSRRLGRLGSPAIAPFTTIFVLLGLALLMGVAQNGASSAVLGLLNWSAPMLFCMHLLMRFKSAEEYEGALFDALAWGVLGISLYGIFQYFAPPRWDAIWMLSSGMVSIGIPVPRKVRVFSTMNSPGPMAAMMVVGTLALLVRGGIMRWVATAPAFVALLLSLVRAAWGGWAIGAAALLSVSSPKRSVRYLAIGAAVAVLATPLILLEPVSSVVTQRMNSMNSADQDVSLRARLELYRSSAGVAGSLLGNGLGASGSATRMAENAPELGKYGVIDSGLIELLLTFGLPGAGLYMAALLTLLVRAGLRARRHPHAGLGFAAAAAIVVQIAFGPVLSGVVGAIFFTFLAMALSPRAGERVTVRAPLAARSPGLLGRQSAGLANANRVEPS